MTLPVAFVGTWKFEYDAAMRAHWEQHFRLEIANEQEILAALVTIDEEAADAQIEITPDGEVVSNSSGAEFYRAKLGAEGAALSFVKPNGALVVLTLTASDEIRAEEPGKPAMRFRRMS